MKRFWKLLGGLALVAAAAYAWKKHAERRPDPAPSAVQQTIDGVTGRTAVRTYMRAKDQLQDIGEQQKQRHQTDL
jgi:hypothetical protein